MKDIDPALYKLPPQNIEAEQSILGSVLLENHAINAAQEIINPNDFYNEAHRRIFSVIAELADKNEPVDLITLSNALKDRKLLDSVGGTAYLASLVDNVPSAANISNYAKIVKEKAILRGLIGSATEIINSCYETGSDVDQVLDKAEHRIFEISENKIRTSFYPIKNIVRESFKAIEDLFTRKELITGVPTGFHKIDDMTSGLQNSDLIIIAGRPSMGKTAFALNIAQHAALETQTPVAIFSLEMSKEQLAFRMLSSEAKVDSGRIRKGYLGETDWPKLTTAAGRLSEASLYIDDTPAITVLEMKAKSRRLKAESGLGLIIVDYIQLMRASTYQNSREQEISEISRSLKALAKELKVPVIALSQLNRKVEDRPNRRPQMADLRESGAIEQDADVIAFIYRDEVYNKSDDNPDKGIAEIIIGKQRNGPTGSVKLAFLDKFTTFENLAHTDTHPQ
ncbi:MAG: Replicative DNA helicase [Deltaproteobacteria bacterium ADurb.Bin151]|jgi:replicative DNA helicase|nr:replicative DNA helicase [Smithella sp.]OQB56881.1 MAG: Replicative DNA helicase [Deltaproteobacteria bacterium ADurb.Bin151]HNZ10643.1 replicative DNA helicase [Smithellaceae bacterium]HOG81314.1 replicative DNA helicase [Smithellaceae bacterium]HOQ42908.1 replicative DNA helicase [Smithellaceae bacterium]